MPCAAGGLVVVAQQVQGAMRHQMREMRGGAFACRRRFPPHHAKRQRDVAEMLPGPAGGMLRVLIPRGVGRGEIVRVVGQGLHKSRGGRGDLLVRITYRPEVRITRR